MVRRKSVKLSNKFVGDLLGLSIHFAVELESLHDRDITQATKLGSIDKLAVCMGFKTGYFSKKKFIFSIQYKNIGKMGRKERVVITRPQPFFCLFLLPLQS